MLKIRILLLLSSLICLTSTLQILSFHHPKERALDITGTEARVSSILLISIPPFGFVLYIPLVYLIIQPGRYTNPFYRFVLAIALNDYYMLLHLMYIGVCLARGECLGGDLINTVLMTLAVYSCYMCMLLNLFVAWNRFAAVFFYLKYDKLFNRRMFIFYYASALILSAIANIPGWKYGMKFYPEWFTHWFVHEPPADFVKIWHLCDLVSGYLLHILLLTFYLAVFFKCYRMAKQSSNVNQHRPNQRLLFQAAINAIPCLLYINCYHFGNEISKFIFTLMCMVMTPFVYLWFNSELRNDFLRLFQRGLVHSSATYTTSSNRRTPNLPKRTPIELQF